MRNLSRREFSYLNAIKKYNDSGEGAKLSRVAKDLNIAASSVFEEINHLEEKGLVKKRKDGIWITDEGIKSLNYVIKAHRVIEILLVNIGIDKDTACEYSKQFDYLVPEEIIDKLYNYLGKPSTCPHGMSVPE
ncbi:DtxR family iron (metal) dependent repressor [Sulfolobus sp. A20]|uniref:metal-dependent transcriptional regulator n=1 Tax=Saccharolobus sp. A20 TaxID=1891280 RepID=UPI000846233F|nr:metal-dependent transcriptional regulator [Sulfolobus sp. A20]TRM77941.1 metal-dependent transcriptional regulator [Sulfolobus sp. A20-N-F8]TRM83427.1 metal-dependent transcriptional regulator [Sulfolobus sp. A20-N-F6]TRM87944.1 metal-dependent transcriptional regulator [Sulfolobus sp. C3]TRM88812.1 metal-dependent transcriptional regulator [Sulfolobus sp. E3]TRN04117.1 metal-dependent transcriptional regulator [Sulfolobus sp. E1]